MKLTLEHYDKKITIEKENDDLDIYEMAWLLRELLAGAGFHHDNINEILILE